MENKITIREAVTENDVAVFWKQLNTYYRRDIFEGFSGENPECLMNSEYHDRVMKINNRLRNGCSFVFFHRNGRDIGFAVPMIFTKEDSRCFIMEFCVYPEFRGIGIGKECAGVLLEWAKERGALYAELNDGDRDRRLRFWKSVGFTENGADECGRPLMILPPNDEAHFSVEVLDDPNYRQLLRLENGFKKDIGEEPLTEEKKQQLQQAIKDGKITFFVAKRGCRAVGMCSVEKCFSTFACADTGVFDDFYIEPVFRKKGIARMLVQTAQNWCKDNGFTSLTVTCASCDKGMYQAFGFDVHLGMTFAHVL